MSKGNLFLGYGRGAVGDLVFYHQDGEQIARARNRNPKNPQTALQLLQRVVLKTSSLAFSLMQDICNHSFQGFAEGTACQSRFNKLNIAMFREQLSVEINSGDADEILGSASNNFASSTASLVEMNPYQVSEGSLKRVPVAWGSEFATPTFYIDVDLAAEVPTYADVLAALNLVSGDQLTFLGLSCDDRQEGGQFNGFEYARVILEPASGDITEPFLSDSSINDPNDRNRGDFQFGVVAKDGAYYLTFIPTSMDEAAGVINAYAAATCIVSRSNGQIWQRSTQFLVVRSDIISVGGHLEWDHGTDYLGDACQSFMSSESSLLYLNQAGGSGKRGVPIAVPRLSAVAVDDRALVRGGSLLLRNNAVDLVAGMTNGNNESTYKVALRAAGSTTNFKEATFTSSQARIANIGIVDGTTYSVVLLEDGEVVDTIGTILYSEASEATLTAVTCGGESVVRSTNHLIMGNVFPIVGTKTGGEAGVTYKLALRVHGQSTNILSATFANNTTTIQTGSWDDAVHYDVVLLADDVVVDTFAQVYTQGGD